MRKGRLERPSEANNIKVARQGAAVFVGVGCFFI